MTSDHDSIGYPKSDDIEMYRLLFQVLWEPETITAPQAEQLFNVAVTAWTRKFEYLVECGLARPLLGRLKGELSRFVAPGLIERLHARATQDAVDDLLKREALGRIAEVLGELGSKGILLKGTALQVLADSPRELPLMRATGDLDLYVEPPYGAELRNRLLAKDFEGSTDEPRTAPHHLAPLRFHGVGVEIHEHIMPSFWGIPEHELIACARSVADFESLTTLNPEGLMLHAGLHASAHLFAHGLKTAWDLLWIQRRFQDLDWDRLAAWVKACRVPRAFWTPVRVLAQELALPVPSTFLGRASNDRNRLKLESIARARIFSAREGPFDLNPFTKTWVFLLFCETWSDRLTYVATLRKGTAAEARRSARKNHPAAMRQRWREIREAFTQWRRH